MFILDHIIPIITNIYYILNTIINALFLVKIFFFKFPDFRTLLFFIHFIIYKCFKSIIFF